MQLIGNRISILEKEGKLSIVIFSYRRKMKNIFLIAWIIAFTLCGLLVLPEFKYAQENDRKIFWAVFIAFWVYFEILVLKALLWRLRGKEKIIITKDVVKIMKFVTGLERFKEYRLDQISNWKKILNDNGLISSYENAYWFVGGECIGFDYYGRDIRFGNQLDDEEAKALIGKIKYFVK